MKKIILLFTLILSICALTACNVGFEIGETKSYDDFQKELEDFDLEDFDDLDFDLEDFDESDFENSESSLDDLDRIMDELDDIENSIDELKKQ